MSELREGAGSGSSRLILVLFFSPFLFRVVLSLSRSNLIILGDASDEEQGSKEGDYCRGKFHRIAFVGFCCKEVKHPNSGLRLVPVPPQLGPRRVRLSFALQKIGYKAQTQNAEIEKFHGGSNNYENTAPSDSKVARSTVGSMGGWFAAIRHCDSQPRTIGRRSTFV